MTETINWLLPIFCLILWHLRIMELMILPEKRILHWTGLPIKSWKSLSPTGIPSVPASILFWMRAGIMLLMLMRDLLWTVFVRIFTENRWLITWQKNRKMPLQIRWSSLWAEKRDFPLFFTAIMLIPKKNWHPMDFRRACQSRIYLSFPKSAMHWALTVSRSTWPLRLLQI